MSIRSKLSYTIIINIVLVCLAFGTSVLIGRMLNPEGMGEYKYIVTLASTIALFSCLGLNEMLNVGLAKKEIRLKDCLASSLIVIMPAFFIVGGVLFYFLFYKDNVSNKPLVTIAFLYCLIFQLNLLFQHTILSMDRLIRYQLFEMSKQLVLLVGAVCLYFIHALNITNLFLILLFANLAAIIYVLYLLFADTNRAKMRFAFSKHLFKNSFQAYLNQILTFMTTRADIFLLTIFVGIEYFELGLYTLAIVLTEKLWIVPDSIRSVLYLELMNQRKGDEFVAKLIRIVVLFALFAGIFTAILSVFVIPLVFGEKFYGSILPFLLLLPGAMFFCFVKVLGTYFVFRDMITINTYMTAINAVINIVCCMILIPRYSYFGAAIAKSIAYILGSIYHVHRFMVVSDTRLSELLFVKKDDFALLKLFFKR